MSLPRWRELGLDSGILAEDASKQDRLVIWRPCGDAAGLRRWERIATVARAKIAERDGLYVIAAVSIPARQCATGGIMGWLKRMRAPRGDYLRLPTGETLERDGARRTDLLVVWPCDSRITIEADSVKRHWPTASIVERLGEHLFVVWGVTPQFKSASVAGDVVESAARTEPEANSVRSLRVPASYPPKVKLPTEPNPVPGIRPMPRKTSPNPFLEPNRGLIAVMAKLCIPDFQFIVEVTETEIVNHPPEGKIERVAFADLRAVIIETIEADDLGPFAPVILWILIGSRPESGCIYPGGATGEQDALKALQRLPGFDNEQLIQAMASVINAKFICWQSAPKPAFNADPSASDRAG